VNVDRNMFIPMATQKYKSWQNNLTKRFSSGLFMTLNYTLSRADGINAGNSDSGLRFYVPSQYSRNNSVSDFDRTHSFTGAANYELPFGRGKKFLSSSPAGKVLGGWQLNPALQLYSGRPFNVTADGGSLAAPGNTQQADQLSEPKKLDGVGLGLPYYEV